MTQLTSLGLGKNQFHGPIPDNISKLSNLRFLGLERNIKLTGNINKLFGPLHKLEYLYLEGNFFDGHLSSGGTGTNSLIHHWPHILELDVSNNMLDGNIPSDLLNHKSLLVVNLEGNYIKGTFPTEIFNNHILEFLSLKNNEIVGTISDRIAYMLKLQHFDISSNYLIGKIPDTLSMRDQLHYLSISDNPTFDSQSFFDMSSMTNLYHLQFSNVNMIGTIPDWIGE